MLCALLVAQDHRADATRLVQGGEYSAALAAAERAEGAERSNLITWTRSMAGDLTGALEEASIGLSSYPNDVHLLEQATRISPSLHLGRDSMGYAMRLKRLQPESDAAYIGDAEALISATKEVRLGQTRAVFLLAAFSLLALALAWWGIRSSAPSELE